MGRRKRKNVVYRPIRKNPTVFACPNCGQNTMKVEKLKRTEGKAYAIIKCSNCLLEERYDQGVGILSDPVDIYAMLVDAFYGEAGDKQNEPISIKTPEMARPAASVSEPAAQTVQVPATQPVQQAQVVQLETPAQPAEQASPSIMTNAEEPKPVPSISGLKVKDRKKAKSEEKVSLADLENKEEITEDFLKEVYLVDEDEEVLDDIKKEEKEKKEKLPFIDVDLDDEDEDDSFK
jgi:transcription elongation factor Elf1